MVTRLPERGLDVLRAIAVLCVLVDHTVASQAGGSQTLWTIGRVGVLIFFVHTSLVLMSSLERSNDRALTFYIRRAFRIYPLAVVTVLVVVALGLPTHVIPGDTASLAVDARTFWANVTLTTNLLGADNVIGPLWSLPLEVQMYAMLPFCFLVASRGVKPTVVLMVAACLLAIGQRLNVHLWRLNILAFGPVFLLGVLLYAHLRAHGPVRDLPESVFTRASHQIAKYSYGLYLLHVPALAVAFVWGSAWPYPIQWAVFGVLLFMLPYAAFHGVEQPSIVYGKRLAQLTSLRKKAPNVLAIPFDGRHIAADVENLPTSAQDPERLTSS